MALALLCTHATRSRTSFDDRAEHGAVGCGLPCYDAGGRATYVGAVETQAYAADELLHVRLGEGRVGAARAARTAVQALGDAADEDVEVDAARPGMRLHHVSKSHG